MSETIQHPYMGNVLLTDGEKLLVDRKVFSDIRRQVFVTQPGKGSIVSIVGTHTAGKSTLRDVWKNRWLREMMEVSEQQMARPQVYYCSVTLDYSNLYNFGVSIVEEFNVDVKLEGVEQKEAITRIYKAFNVTPLGEEMDVEERRKRRAYLKELSAEEREEYALDQLIQLFKLFKKAGLHIILVIDEVQSLKEEEEKASFFKWLYQMANDLDSYAVSILLLSQIGMDILLQEVDGLPNNFANNFMHKIRQYVLPWFTNSELRTFVLQMGQKEEQLRNNAHLWDMLYYGGRFPGLLGIIGKHICENSSREELNIKKIHDKEEKELIEDVYDFVIDRLEQEQFVSIAAEEIGGVNVFLDAFTDPDYVESVEYEEWLQLLYRKGYISKAEAGEYGHINDFIKRYSGKEEREYPAYFHSSLARELGYEPLSPAFLEYIQEKKKREEDEKIRDLRILMRKTERKVREVLYQGFIELDKIQHPTAELFERWKRINGEFFGNTNNVSIRNGAIVNYINTYTAALDADAVRLRGRNNSSYNTNKAQVDLLESESKELKSKISMWQGRGKLKSKIENSTRYRESCKFTIVDVLSFRVYYLLMTKYEQAGVNCWDKIKRYLLCYSDQNDVAFKEDFQEELHNARNSFAHDTAEIDFSVEEKRIKVETICKKVKSSIEYGQWQDSVVAEAVKTSFTCGQVNGDWMLGTIRLLREKKQEEEFRAKISRELAEAQSWNRDQVIQELVITGVDESGVFILEQA